jgi:hypothetical protein
MHHGSAHFKDQMGMFQQQKLKKMSLDKNEVLQHAERIYSPQ